MAPGLEALKKEIAGKYAFRYGSDDEGRRFGIQYIPSLVAVDAQGKLVHKYDAGGLVKAQKAGNFVQHVLPKLPGGK